MKKRETNSQKWQQFIGIIILSITILVTFPLLLMQVICKYLSLGIIIFMGLLCSTFGIHRAELPTFIIQMYKKFDEIGRW